jgi:Cys-tRNA(Pro) deacylase
VSVKYPITLAIRTLRQHGVEFEPFVYAWEPRGGTEHSARELRVPEHQVVKTLIFEDERKQPLCILMHGDREVSGKSLARHLGRKSVAPCAPEIADRHSGYQVGGTSPFGLKRAMPIHVERTILALPRIYINGGARGFLVALAPQALLTVLGAVPVDVAIERS